MKTLLPFLIILPCFCMAQNAVIVYRTKNELTVGTNTFQIAPSYAKLAIPESFIKEGKYYFVTTGMVDKKTITAAEESCRQGKTLTDVINLYKEKRTASFADDMYQAKNTKTDIYKSWLQNKYVFSILFFTVENDTPKAAKIEFYVKDKINGGVSIELNVHRIPGKNPDASSVLTLGQRDAFNSKELFNDAMHSDPAKEIEQLLRKQINHVPGGSEFPIHIIQIKDGKTTTFPEIYS
jgi:hypothetical protein